MPSDNENSRRDTGHSQFEHRGWTARAVTGPILASGAAEQLEGQLAIKLPGMVFGDSNLSLVHGPTGVRVSFRPLGALSAIGKADPSIRVAAAEKWKERVERSEFSILEGASDWTFTSTYIGDVERCDTRADGRASEAENACLPVEFHERPNAATINYDSLRDTSIPILHYKEVILFEDELDDNGTSSYRVRLVSTP